MTIRYVRDGLRVVRLQTAADLTALHHQAAAVEGEARDFKHRVQALKEGLLADHRHRVGLAQEASARERAEAPRVGNVGVRLARQRTGLTQRQLATELGLSRSCIACGESGPYLPHPRLARWAHDVLRPGGRAEAQP